MHSTFYRGRKGRIMRGTRVKFRSGIFMILLAVMLSVAAALAAPSKTYAAATIKTTKPAKVQNGFVYEGGATYYYVDGKMVKGWRTIGSDRYYFSKTDGKMIKYWLKLDDARYYFAANGKLVKDKMLYDSKKRVYRYITHTGRLKRGWQTLGNGHKRFFSTSVNNLSKDGIMAQGFVKAGSATYYFQSKTGYQLTGWITRKSDGARFYLDPAKNGALVVSTTKTIDGVTYVFDKKGVSTIQLSPAGTVTRMPGSAKTVRNYLLNGLQACGRVLYIWGGGWTQSTVKGVPSSWTNWYNSQPGTYNYNNYRDLTTANRVKGLDCSGFVGWTTYQTMQSTSGATSYTVVSGSVGGSYANRGFGTIITQSQLRADGYKLYPGDIGYDAGHVWMIVGQCKDKSCVVLHSIPQAGVQLSGTPTPAGNYDSQAVQLCNRYMSIYPGFTRFPYETSCGNYVTRSNYFRWYRSTLADPEGFMTKNANQVLSSLFS